MSVYTSTRWRSQRSAAPSARRRSTTSTISVPSTYWCSAFRSSAGIARSWSHGSRPSSIARRKRWFAAEYGIASSSTTKWSRCSSITKVGGRAEARLVGSTGSLEKINERCSSTFSAEPVVDSPSVAGDSPSARGRDGFVGDDGSGGSGGTGGSGGGELPSRRFLKSILKGTNSFVSADDDDEGEPLIVAERGSAPNRWLAQHAENSSLDRTRLAGRDHAAALSFGRTRRSLGLSPDGPRNSHT